MLPGHQLSTRTIKLCMVLKWLSVIAAVLYLYFFFYTDTRDNITTEYWDRLAPAVQEATQVTALKKNLLILVLGLRWLGDLLLLAGCWYTFKALESGHPFSLKVAKAVRLLGVFTVIGPLIHTIVPTLIILVMTMDNPKGLREFTIIGNLAHLRLLLLGMLFFILAQIFHAAVRISDEHRQIV